MRCGQLQYVINSMTDVLMQQLLALNVAYEETFFVCDCCWGLFLGLRVN